MNRNIKICILCELILLHIAIALHVFVFDAAAPTALFFYLLIGSLHFIIFKLCINSNLNRNEKYLCKSPHLSSPLFSPASVLILLICYVLTAMLFYPSWINGDEGVALHISTLSFKDRVVLGCSSYFKWVPRIGEQIYLIGNLNINRWQHWVISPLFLLLIPIGFWRLLKKRTETYSSYRFLIFFCFIYFLFFAMDGRGTWDNYVCYVPFLTYIWPAATSIFLLSSLNPATWHDNDFKFPTVKCILMFLLGLYSGWGSECATVMILPILLIWLLYRWFKKLPTPHTCMSSILGFAWGAMLMFISTAHHWRTTKLCNSSRFIQPECMTYDELWNLVTNITPDVLVGLGERIILLHGIPYHLHIFFFPVVVERFWDECCIPTCVLFILLATSLFFRNLPKKK